MKIIRNDKNLQSDAIIELNILTYLKDSDFNKNSNIV